jgi:hypothetical protein
MLKSETSRPLLANAAALALLLCGASAESAERTQELVATQNQLAFYSPFWQNLHHVLYAEAWQRRNPAPGRSLAGTLPEPLTGDLTPEERAAWDAAVAYYDRDIADHNMLFDLGDIRRALYAGAGKLPDKGLGKAHHDALAAAAPVYAKFWWPAHDRANRAWIAETLPRLAQLSPEVPNRLARLYDTRWFQTPARVDVVRVGIRQGAYSADDPAPGYITISSGDPNDQGWHAAEVVFHESSHALFQIPSDAITREEREQRKNTRDLWHVALFYITGEVVREALAARKIEYSPYLYDIGLFDRAWPQFKQPIEHTLPAYIDGKASLADAIHALVAEAPAPAPPPPR